MVALESQRVCHEDFYTVHLKSLNLWLVSCSSCRFAPLVSPLLQPQTHTIHRLIVLSVLTLVRYSDSEESELGFQVSAVIRVNSQLGWDY